MVQRVVACRIFAAILGIVRRTQGELHGPRNLKSHLHTHIRKLIDEKLYQVIT